MSEETASGPVRLPFDGSTLAESVELFRAAIEGALRGWTRDRELTVSIDAGVEPQWVRSVTGWSWGRRMPATIATSGDLGQSELFWPEPCDPDARAPRPHVVTGMHRGVYLGRPLAVTTGVRLAPGLHAIARNPGSGWRVHGILACDLGPDFAVGTAWRDAVDKEHAQTDALARFAAFLADHAATAAGGQATSSKHETRLLCAPTVAGLVAVLHPHEELGRADPWSMLSDPRATSGALLGWLLGQLSAAVDGTHRVYRTDRAVSRALGLHDVVAESALQSALVSLPRELARKRTTGRATALTLVERLATALTLALDSAVRDLAAGRGGWSASIGEPGAGMTITRIEALAKTSFTGPRGLATSLRGRSDLRQLTEDWRGILCPVQTPESTEVGLIRHQCVSALLDTRDQSAADLGDWADLSASAALIPFVNHDDPARASIGSKNLKQALPVNGAEPPLVRTGWESPLAEYAGVVRSPIGGRVADVGPQNIVVEGQTGRSVVGYGAPALRRSGPDVGWTVCCAVGDQVRRGDALAHAPDVRLDDKGDALLAYGVNALVAMAPFEGYNYEDGIVVSDALAARLASSQLVRMHMPWEPGAIVDHVADLFVGRGESVDAGSVLAQVSVPGEPPRRLIAPEEGTYLGSSVDPERGEVAAWIRVERPLRVGDKLSNRHQGKGVVSRIVPTAEMPRLPDGRPVEAILNPLGVLRRLNIGQFWEMHVGLPALLARTGSVTVGRRVADPDAVGAACAVIGAPHGRMPLVYADGRRFGGPDGVVVGPQYLMKLDHLAVNKISVRGARRGRSPRSLQPSRTACWVDGARIGAAQRLGEMEVWALQAVGADAVLADAFNERAARSATEAGGVRPTLQALAAHLRVAEIEVLAEPGSKALAEVALADVTGLSLALADDPLDGLPALGDLVALTSPGFAKRMLPKRAREATHPLYRADWHGELGSPQRARVRYAIPLPVPVAHPWGSAISERPLECIPLLPPAFRVLDADPLDDRYADLARCSADVRRLGQLCEQGRWSRLILRQLSGEPLPIESVDWPEPSVAQQVLLGKTPDNATPAESDFVYALRRLRDAIVAILGSTSGPDTDPASILGRVGGKHGLLRRFLLGQSVTSSGRSVIVPDPQRFPQSVGLPPLMYDQLGVTDDGEHGDVVIVNRQPTLHPYNLVALRAERGSDDAVHLPPFVIGGLAGDFDGDAVAVHRPVNPIAREEAWRLLSPSATLRSGAGGAVLAKLDLDVALGLTLLATGPAGGAEVGPLPEAIRDRSASPVQGPLTKADIDSRVAAFVARSTRGETTLAALFALERAGWAAATGWSIGALELLSDGRAGHLGEAIRAGAAGKESGIAQLLERRGALPGGNQFLSTRDVPGCFLTGLTSDDFFATAPAAIAGLAEKKLTSPHAGALTKTLVEIADRVVIDGDDCGADVSSPLTCRSGPVTVCRACYGQDRGSGTALADGRRVGLLAAMFIGERSTQLSMKVFQGGGVATGALGGGIRDLKALFGDGQTSLLDPEQTLERVFAQCSSPADPRLADVTESALAILGGVDPVHVQVIVRQLWEGRKVRKKYEFDTLARRAERHGRSALERATSRGNVGQLAPLGPRGMVAERLAGPSGPRTALVLGKVRDV